MSEYYASPEDYDWMVRTLGKKKADEMVRRDNMQIRPNEVEFTPISGVGGMDEEYEDEETLGGLTAAEQGDEMALDYQNPADVARAIQRSSLEQKAYYDALAEQLKAKRYGPTASERLFALSAAFAAPTSTRGFGGMMGNVMPVFQQFEKSKREAEEARAEDMQKLQMARMGATQAEIKSALDLQKLQAQYNNPEPLVVPPGSTIVSKRDPTKILTTTPGVSEEVTTLNGRQFIKGPKGLQPLTSEPKFRAATPEEAAMYGAKSGQINTTTGEFKPVAQAPQAPRKLSSTEQRELIDTEDLLTKGTSTAGLLQEALRLNNTAYEGSLSGVRKTLGQLFSSDSPEYVATEQLDNLIGTSALSSLKETFGGNPTEGERKILLDLQASSSKPRAVRQQILARALEAAQKRIRINTQRLDKLKGGYYSTQGGTSSPQPTKVIRFDRNGNRI